MAGLIETDFSTLPQCVPVMHMLDANNAKNSMFLRGFLLHVSPRQHQCWLVMHMLYSKMQKNSMLLRAECLCFGSPSD